MKNILYITLFCALIVGCSGGGDEEISEENTAPSVPSLIFPVNNQLCTETNLNLQWEASIDNEGDTVEYVLQIATDAGITEIFHESTFSANSKELNFERGVNYYWRVKAKDSQQANSDYSSVNSFYSEGVGSENHIPFSPSLVAPSKGSSIAAGSVKLEWDATDLDTNDVLSYDVFVGNSSVSLQSEATDISNKFINTTLNTSGTYYWRVDVKDSNGGVTIGQVWEFTIL